MTASAGRRSGERLALGIVVALLIALPASLLAAQMWRTRAAGVRVVDVVARVPEDGGFSPDSITLRAGETVRLRLTSPDVVHGLTIPGLGVVVDEIYPGVVTEVDVTAKAPGRYAFACTRWCGADHWRMRGAVEVTQADGSPAPLPEPAPPLFQRLGLDIDAMRHAPHALPAGQPSARRGAALDEPLPGWLADEAERRALAPADAYHRLRQDPALAGRSDDELWDRVAYAWLKEIPQERLSRAAGLYARDCAACHGVGGTGDGPAGAALPGMQKMDPEMPAGPARFTDAGQMLTASDALLQGKLLRGGMGTGMPEFGSLYTDAEMWDMVAYLRTFTFQN
jgi:mono/diheme cytochrome c family protein/plastocyanin